jgi:hypothetical protein
MDNINMTDKLVDRLADAMVKRIYGVEQREARKDMTYYAERADDNAVGELARLMTLLNLYEEREEYEKCHAVKKHLDKVNKIVENL